MKSPNSKGIFSKKEGESSSGSDGDRNEFWWSVIGSEGYDEGEAVLCRGYGTKIEMDLDNVHVAFESGFSLQADYQGLLGVPLNPKEQSDNFQLYLRLRI